MDTKSYVCWFRLDGQDGYLIWQTNGSDGVYVDKNAALAFHDLTSLRAYAKEAGISIVEENPVVHNLDQLAQWLLLPNGNMITADSFLDAWNLFSDVAGSLRIRFDASTRITNPVYEKLFYSCNLPSATPEGQTFKPMWSVDETNIMVSVLSDGLKLFRKAVRFHQR